MIITELYIKNFGMLSGKRIRFEDGVQVIYGENESGKTTLHAFIRAMLFGMERGRGKAAAKDDFTRYEPWENPGNYAGIMWFSCGGKRFRLERNFDRYTKRTLLVCEDDGEELSVGHGDLEMLLGGMTLSLYGSTVSVGQLAARPGQELCDALENYAANFCESGGGDIDVNGVLKSLKEKERLTACALKKETEEREEQRRRMLEECSYLEEDIETLTRELEEKKKAAAKLSENFRGQNNSAQINSEENSRAKNSSAQSSSAQNGRAENSRAQNSSAKNGSAGKMPAEEKARSAARAGAFGAGGLAAVCAGLIGSILTRILAGHQSAADFIQPVFSLLILAGLGLLAAGAYLYLSGRQAAGGRSEEYEQEYERKESGLKETGSEDAAHREALHQIRGEMEHIRAERREKEIRRSNLYEQCSEMKAGEKEKSLGRRVRALRLAQEQMRLAAQELGRRTSASLNKRASDILAGITEGRYRSMDIGEKLQISVWDGSRRIPAERLSRGTLEQIYFSVRMAAAEVLQEEPMPVILDDTFAFYDEKRLKSALKWLRGQKRQVIILSCNRREEEILKQF